MKTVDIARSVQLSDEDRRLLERYRNQFGHHMIRLETDIKQKQTALVNHKLEARHQRLKSSSQSKSKPKYLSGA